MQELTTNQTKLVNGGFHVTYGILALIPFLGGINAGASHDEFLEGFLASGVYGAFLGTSFGLLKLGFKGGLIAGASCLFGAMFLNSAGYIIGSTSG